MPRVLSVLAFAALLALPIGLTTALVSDALLRVGVWLDAPFARVAAGGADGTGRAGAELLLERDGARATIPLDAWRAAATASLARPVPVPSPYAETIAVGAGGAPPDDLEAGVHTFELDVRAPDALRVASLAAEGGLIVDVFDAGAADAAGVPRPLGSYGPGPVDVRVSLDAAPARTTAGASGASAGAPEPGSPGRLLVRVQTTPGASGRFALLLETRPALDFPVATDDPSPVRSFFGAERDGGARRHHGIDVFAPRGTPVVAAADGIVVRTGDSPRGGLHVWQRAVDGAGSALGALYYAHLDRVDVATGDPVRRGDRLGTVGNTGNARTTPPHLHFGLYRRFAGPEDPLPLTGPRRVPRRTLEAGPALPRWLAVRAPRANLRAGPGTDHRALGTLERGELVRIDALAAGGRWVRASAGDGRTVWLARSLLAPPGSPGQLGRIGPSTDAALPPAPFELAASPSVGAATLATIDDLAGIEPLGRFGRALRVRTADGLVGWVRAAPAP